MIGSPLKAYVWIAAIWLIYLKRPEKCSTMPDFRKPEYMLPTIWMNKRSALIDVWGVGTKLITAYDQPALGAVYKLIAIENETGEMVDTIKISSIQRRLQLRAENGFIASSTGTTANRKAIILRWRMKNHRRRRVSKCSIRCIRILPNS
ncbi:hypothetical protein FHS19_001422 [Paenibacillus rhizosphaerae]|uniref:Uncharacterized protein n=1 Tax=Paenibacillus rhizosphaerae TaxID=297318 RepID=A0A839TMY1_9BACL|nr:hypothetical protein [Paenibacillus rhizosphaerae]